MTALYIALSIGLTIAALFVVYDIVQAAGRLITDCKKWEAKNETQFLP
jgi:hypothetical protein